MTVAGKARDWLNRIGPANRIVVVQVAAAVAMALVLSLVAFEQALAVALSAAACIAPTALFALCASRWRNAPAIVLVGFLKLIAVVGCLVVAFVVAQPAPLGFILGLVAAHLAYLAAPFVARPAHEQVGLK